MGEVDLEVQRIDLVDDQWTLGIVELVTQALIWRSSLYSGGGGLSAFASGAGWASAGGAFKLRWIPNLASAS